jgi:hypothetical protein
MPFEHRVDSAIDFDGATYEASKDQQRLSRQLRGVYEAVRVPGWYTLRQLSEIAHASEASVSARLRDLRKDKFGGFTIERRRVSGGLFEYRLVSHMASDGCSHLLP